MDQYRHVYKALIKLGLPLMVGQIGFIILGFADTIMVGQFGTKELAAASFVTSIFNLAIIFATGFSYAITTVIGHLYGRDDFEHIGEAFKSSLYSNALMGVLLSAILLILYSNIHLLGQPAELLPLIKPYFLVNLASIIFVLLFAAFKQFSDGITNTVTPMWIMIICNAINIALNYILIFGKLGVPEMGLLGAGMATLIARVLMVVLSVIVLLKSNSYAMYRLGLFKSHFKYSTFKELILLGMPIALQMGMETAAFSLSTIMVGWLGTVELAAHQIMCTVGQLGYMMYYGMAAAVSVRVSVFHGRNDILNCRKTSTSGFHLIVLMSIFVSFLVFTCRTTIASWFTTDVAVQMSFVSIVIPFAIYQIGDGLQCNYANALRGIKDVRPVMIIAFIAFFILCLPMAYILGFKFQLGLLGIWYAFPLGLTSAGLMYLCRYYYRLKKEQLIFG